MQFNSTLCCVVLLFILGCTLKGNKANNPASSLQAVGDINLNGQAYEIADAILFSHYFVNGPSVFTVDELEQIAATDVTRDGQPLTLEDLVFLTRSALEGNQRLPHFEQLTIDFYPSGCCGFWIADSFQIGAALLVVEGQVSPYDLPDGMEVSYYFNGTHTNILVWSSQGNSCSGYIIGVSGRVISVKAATSEAQAIQFKTVDPFYQFHWLPVSYNSGNETYYIHFYLAENADASIVITDRTGRILYNKTALFVVGYNRIEWDAKLHGLRNLPDGIYYVNFTSGVFKSTLEIHHNRESELREAMTVQAGARPIDYIGDINLNGLSFEIADLLLYMNYFLYGPSVFSVRRYIQMAATDVNHDRNILTVADLVYLSNVVRGEASLIPSTDTLTVKCSFSNSGILSILDNVMIGAVYVEVSGNESPQLLAEYTELRFAYDGEHDCTKILVFGYDYGPSSFSGSFLSVSGNLISIEMATHEGQPVKEEVLDNSFDLRLSLSDPVGNTIKFYLLLPIQGEATLTVTDGNGRLYFDFEGAFNAGITSLIWDISNYSWIRLPDGIYYCTLKVGKREKTIQLNLRKWNL